VNSRFCLTCGTSLVRTYVESSIEKEKKKRIAKYIVTWYEDWRRSHRELEETMLEEIDATTCQGRFEIILLATLFSEYGVTEERAHDIWVHIKSWFQKNYLDYVEVFVGDDARGLAELKNESANLRIPPKFLINMAATSRNLLKHGGELNNLVVEDGWVATINNLRSTMRGVDQKAFWIARIMRQKGMWNIPGEYCCVSDSHVKALLQKTGFIVSTEDLFHNSRIMWEHFNQPFSQKYYDLSVFRYARSKGCKYCNFLKCGLETLGKCLR